MKDKDADEMSGAESADWFRQKFSQIRQEVEKCVLGQDHVVTGVLTSLAANGHVLLEGMPGLGKTLLVRVLGEAVTLSFSRVQFTPDMMPADITGTNVLMHDESGERRFEFRPGPIFANLVLADEINRATPKTQSALLEAMQERTVTVSGSKKSLDEPFLVMATQNPIEQEGTYPLPEAQLDRFFLKLLVPFPKREDLAKIVDSTTGSGLGSASPVATGQDVVTMRKIVAKVPVAPSVLDYALTIVLGTHPDGEAPTEVAKKYSLYGASPRGGQALITAAKVAALLDGRFNVSKEDILQFALPALRHRIGLNFEAEAEGVSPDGFLKSVLAEVKTADRDPIQV